MRFEVESAPDPPDRRLGQPDPSAIDVRDQCVAFFGVSSSVAVTTSSTLSSRIEGGRPGRGSSSNPSRRLSTKRRRHLATVCSITRKSAATCLFVAPGAAQANMIRARNANACADFARRDHRCSWSRSAARAPDRPSGVPAVGCRSNRPHPRLQIACATCQPSPPSHPDRPPPAPAPPPARPTPTRSWPEPHAATTHPAKGQPVGRAPRSVNSNLPTPDTAESIRSS